MGERGSGSKSGAATPSEAAAGTARAFGLPGVSLPKGGGAIRGIGEKFSTNPATGTASLSIPLALSPGRDGFQLELVLQYDSGNGNGPFGLGWRLALPSIVRKTDQGLPRYRDDDAVDADVFVLSGGEDLVPVPFVRPDGGEEAEGHSVESGIAYRIRRYRPRSETLFARIERWIAPDAQSSHWRVYSRDNVLTVYGRSAQARIANPQQPAQVYAWLVEETRDDRGNVARYTYRGEDGAGVSAQVLSESSRFLTAADGSQHYQTTAQRYLKRIQYGNRRPLPDRTVPLPTGDDDYLFEVLFDFGEHAAPEHGLAVQAPQPDAVTSWMLRPDAFSERRAGFELRTCRRCRRVLTLHRFAELGTLPCLVRSTDLEYADDAGLAHLVRVIQCGYLRDDSGDYQRAFLPPLELDYVQAAWNETWQSLDQSAQQGLRPAARERVQWVDLDGEGIPGVLIPAERAWYYRHNRGSGELAPPRVLPSLPVASRLDVTARDLVDLGADGDLDLVSYASVPAGYITRTAEGGWSDFHTFPELPTIDWNAPGLRFVDLDGDGLPDLLLSESEALIWYRSCGRQGFAPGVRLIKPKDEAQGPAILFADGEEALHLADMTGDGLADIVRVRNGEVCYWPNLGHGRFGRKVSMDGAVPLDGAARFDPRRVFLADIDGSGTSDVIYRGADGVRIHANVCGNRLVPRLLQSLPPAHDLAGFDLVDLLGNGTSCLVWTSPLPGQRSGVYVDLMNSRKPHLLSAMRNNFGGETRLSYASSTAFYLRDKAAGIAWLTRLPFPVQVVERIDHLDHVAGTRLVSRMAYRHGYFDAQEREFRGFARVDRWDAQTLDADAPDAALDLPPVHTITWFHTGAWHERERLEAQLAREYYAADARSPLLGDTRLPPGLNLREQREAARALRGQVLREEVYADDASAEREHPYTVSERSYAVRHLYTAPDGHGVFHVHGEHTLNLNYERRPDDPRLQHEAVLAVDEGGNVTSVAAIAYPRRNATEAGQQRAWLTCTQTQFANHPHAADWRRLGVELARHTGELTGLTVPDSGVFGIDQLRQKIAAAATIDYDVAPAAGLLQLRTVEHSLQRYYSDDLRSELAFGQIESRALPCESYRMAFTAGLLRDFGSRVDAAVLRDEGGYLLHGSHWWAPSGKTLYDAAAFFHPVGAIDPFGNRHTLRLDAYALLPREVEDALHNRVVVANDYRVLAPWQLTDPNLNRLAVAFDTLGLVVSTAALGKAGAGEGDTLADPGTRVEYDLLRWITSDGRQPAVVRTLARETHGGTPRWQESVSYTDGSCREILRKTRAEAGPAPARDADGRLQRNPDGSLRLVTAARRWVGSGRTVFNNKGKPVRQYEPYFSASGEYENEAELVESGVTALLHYDALGRMVRVDKPDGTHTLTRFDAWHEQRWDEIDTIAGTPWLARKQGGAIREKRCASLALAQADTPALTHLDALGREFLTVQDNGAAGFQSVHSQLDVEGNLLRLTDARGVLVQRQLFDVLARPLRVVRADCGEWDAATQQRRVAVADDPDGLRRLLDVAGKPIRIWTERGHAIRSRYDALQRLTHVFVDGGSGEALREFTVYGESLPLATAQAANLLTRGWCSHDGAGQVENVRFDFKGNLLQTRRRLPQDGTAPPAGWDPLLPDWIFLDGLPDTAALTAAADPRLLPAHAVQRVFDALNRVVSRTTPDGSETRPGYNEAGLLETLDVRLRGAAVWTSFIAGVDYNARGQTLRTDFAATAGSEAFSTSQDYDALNFRLRRQRSERRSDGSLLQDLAYEYDPVGNVVQVTDRVSFGRPKHAPVVDPEADVAQRLQAGYGDSALVYDALYQLVESRGRHQPGTQPDHRDRTPGAFTAPGEPQDLQTYLESFRYDAGGNLLQVANKTLGSGVHGWTRHYAYADDSNRLLRTSAPGDSPGTLSAAYVYDRGGNMEEMPHLPQLRWDHADRLVAVRRQLAPAESPPNDVYCLYAADGERIAKIYVHGSLVEKRVYLGGYEIYQRYRGGAATPEFERHSLHVDDSGRRIALAETTTIDSAGGPLPKTRLRFQIASPQQSSLLELDPAGAVIGYEEFYAFGASAFRAAASHSEVSAKRYRYIGRERDEETGLYQCSARYYAAWLGRWCSADPAGLADGCNRYGYCRNNPLRLSDPDGTRGKESALQNPQIVVPGKFTGGESQDAIRAQYAQANVFYKGEASWDSKHRSWWVDRSRQETSLTFEDEVVVGERKPPEATPAPAEPAQGGGVGQPGALESAIPIWGSGRSAVDHFQHGNWGRGVLFTALAVSDVFLVKSLVTAGGKLVVQGGAKLLGKSAAASGGQQVASGATAAVTKTVAADVAKAGGTSAPKLLTAGVRRFAGDEGVNHFGKHAGELMQVLGKRSYNLAQYLDDANHVIQTGHWVPEMNAYVRIVASNNGSAKALLVGINRASGAITTFHVKSLREIAKKAPSLGLIL